MKYLVIDTCIILHILRGKELGKRCVDAINAFDKHVSMIISAVTKAELESLKMQQGWVESRQGIRNYMCFLITQPM